MNTHEDSAERLDTEFDHILLDMKPYVLKHPNRTGKIDIVPVYPSKIKL